MTRRVSTAVAKARLSELIGAVAFGRERVVIERRGRPVAALVSVEDATALDQAGPIPEDRQGALALVGAWHDVDEELMDRLVDDLQASRTADLDRPIDLPE